jgi:hypothetical protein
VIALSDPDSELGERSAGSLGVERTYADYPDLLDDDNMF